MTERPLDLDAVAAFTRIAELGSFTRAAEAMQTTQAAVSLKLKRLEDRLGIRLVERTPRRVQLSAAGESFLEHARALIEAHERALAAFGGSRQRLAIGISDHVAGPELPSLIARMNAQDPQLLIEIRIGSSGDLLQSFDRRELDTVIVRMDYGRGDGEVLAEEKLGWFASPQWEHRAGEPLPVATLAEPCGVRVLSSKLLDEAGVPWTEIFVGRSRRQCGPGRRRPGAPHAGVRRGRSGIAARPARSAAATHHAAHTREGGASARSAHGPGGRIQERGAILEAAPVRARRLADHRAGDL